MHLELPKFVDSKNCKVEFGRQIESVEKLNDQTKKELEWVEVLCRDGVVGKITNVK